MVTAQVDQLASDLAAASSGQEGPVLEKILWLSLACRQALKEIDLQRLSADPTPFEQTGAKCDELLAPYPDALRAALRKLGFSV